MVEQLACCVRALWNYADPLVSAPSGATGVRPALSGDEPDLEDLVVEMRCHMKQKLDTGMKRANAARSGEPGLYSETVWFSWVG